MTFKPNEVELLFLHSLYSCTVKLTAEGWREAKTTGGIQKDITQLTASSQGVGHPASTRRQDQGEGCTLQMH